ncbi:hypothetical protein RIVM261_049280 [Rivularia sp. IAM M-261]|nr:hypothetical protein RIVM261_049280 [Rivularia sp. IAM M-261]
MNRLIIRGASILAVSLGIAFTNASFNSTASAQQQELPNTSTSSNRSNTNICNSVPPARPTGGATLTRILVLQECYKNIAKGTIQSATGVCDLPQAKPTGGATSTRMQVLQECYRERLRGTK